MKMSKSIIDLDEQFPRLSNAPIVEAALDIRVVPPVKWDESSLENELKKRLPNYSKIEPVREARYQLSPGKPGHMTVEDFGCVGFKLHSNDNLHIAQFNKSAFVFSRLRPYEDWNQFSQEATRLLVIYHELLHPTEVIRIGLRFINRIDIQSETVELADYYKYPPEPLRELNWPLTGYINHDVVQVPGTPYSVNLIKTIQHTPGETGLILDIDVFMQNNFEYDEPSIIKYLKEMRWVKDKIFFNSLAEKALAEFR